MTDLTTQLRETAAIAAAAAYPNDSRDWDGWPVGGNEERERHAYVRGYLDHAAAANGGTPITTVEQLLELPVGSVIRQAPEDDPTLTEYPDGSWERGAVAEKRLDIADVPTWFIVGSILGYRSHQADLLPATVLYLPPEQRASNE